MRDATVAPSRILRFPELQLRVRLSRSSIDRLERAGLFPTRIRISANSIGWLEAEIDQWIAARAERQGPTRT